MSDDFFKMLTQGVTFGNAKRSKHVGFNKSKQEASEKLDDATMHEIYNTGGPVSSSSSSSSSLSSSKKASNKMSVASNSTGGFFESDSEAEDHDMEVDGGDEKAGASDVDVDEEEEGSDSEFIQIDDDRHALNQDEV